MQILKGILFLSLIISLVNCSCLNATSSDSSNQYNELDSSDNFTFYDPTASKSVCRKRSFDTYERTIGGYKCCYADVQCQFYDESEEEYIIYSYKGCTVLTKNDYDELDEYIKKIKELSACSKYTINCSATSISYLRKLIYLAFILIFFL